jgi:restriction system protein
MKFPRMAHNSLFAVLLRSPWWVSLLLALAVFAATQALLPAEYRVVGGMGCMPFVVIGVIAAWKQRGAVGPEELERLVAIAAKLPRETFVARLGDALASQGYAVQRGRDGADLLIERGGRLTVVGAARWKAARHGEDALQAVKAAMDRTEAAYGLYLALGEVSPQAQRIAKDNAIDIVQGARLGTLLKAAKLEQASAKR